MTDFSSLQIKVNDLKAKVSQNSITPAYLGALLDDFISQMKAIDMTGMSDDVRTAVNNAASALSTAQSALTKAGNAETTATSATANALSALEKADQALTRASNAETIAGSALSSALNAKDMAADAQTNAAAAVSFANDAVSRISDIEDKVAAPNGIAVLDENAKIPVDNLPIGETEGSAFPGNEGAMLRDDVTELSNTVSQVADAVSKHVDSVGIRDFIGTVPSESDLKSVNTDGVYYVANSNGFFVSGVLPLAHTDYNTFDRTGALLHPRTDLILRCGSTLYRYDNQEKKLAEIGGGAATGNVINIHEITKDWNATNRGAAAVKVPLSPRTGSSPALLSATGTLNNVGVRRYAPCR